MADVEKLMSDRLKMIAGCVEGCDKAFDTGSDHAFVPIFLVQKGVCPTAVASDVRKGPAKVASRNVRKFGLQDSVSVEIGDGIENAKGCDCIIVAGMGGQLICDIIKRREDMAKEARQLVLQPMNASEKVRRFLWDGGYTIYFEDLCSEKGKVYNVICARYEGKPRSYSEHELHSSKYLVENRHPLLNDFILKKLRRLKAMYRGSGGSDIELAKIIKNLEGLIK